MTEENSQLIVEEEINSSRGGCFGGILACILALFKKMKKQRRHSKSKNSEPGKPFVPDLTSKTSLRKETEVQENNEKQHEAAKEELEPKAIKTCWAVLDCISQVGEFVPDCLSQVGESVPDCVFQVEESVPDCLSLVEEESVARKFYPEDSLPDSEDTYDQEFLSPPSTSSSLSCTHPELLMWPRGALLTFYSTVVDPPAILLMGTDKYENDHLISQATERVLFFHVDNLPSAHVYLQLEADEGLEDVSQALLHDAAQLCKANSSQGNKLANVVVMYTLGSNLRKDRHMKAGEVGFVKERDVRKILIAKRDEKVMSRLNQTKSKVLSAKAEREKQEKVLERQQQKAKIKDQRRQQRLQQQQANNGPQMDACQHSPDANDAAWGIEPDEPSTSTCAAGRSKRRKKKECTEHEHSDEPESETETPMQKQTVRCFPVTADQRRVLQGCRAQVERRHDVRVDPPRKGDAEGRGSITGNPKDVAEALAELRRLLHGAAEPLEPQGNKGKKNNTRVKDQSKKTTQHTNTKVNKTENTNKPQQSKENKHLKRRGERHNKKG